MLSFLTKVGPGAFDTCLVGTPVQGRLVASLPPSSALNLVWGLQCQ